LGAVELFLFIVQSVNLCFLSSIVCVFDHLHDS
jgi:hypothetical protein